MGAVEHGGRDPLWTRLAWLLPAVLFVAVALAPIEPVRAGWPWVPSLGVQASFHFDALSRLFLLLITGIGTLVFFYAPGYLHGHPGLGRLVALLAAFMLAMMGAVTADDMILLFVFWEATSILSFLLVGFDNERRDSRASALQALLITAGGGLALLCGVLLIQTTAPGLKLSDLSAISPAVRSDPRFTAGVALVVVGCMTKSAQFPFHFWLPGAMAAPTPVSAYLHSATMVKLGVYLLARFDDAMGSSPWWSATLLSIGTLTAAWAAVQALRERDLKRILAWSTVSALGVMTLLIGLPGERSALGLSAFVLAHALYKAPLFFVAGNVDHGTGTRIIDRLRGLWRAMPLTAAAAVIAGLSMAGLPATFGFVAKEAITTAKEVTHPAWIVGIVVIFTSALGVAVAAVATVRIFFGRMAANLPIQAHEGGLRLVLPPLLPAVVGIVLGLRPALIEPLVFRGARAVAPTLDHATVALSTDWMLQIGTMTTVTGLGIAFYVLWDRIHRALETLRGLERIGPAALYERGLAGLKHAATALTLTMQDGRLGFYMSLTTIGALAACAWWLIDVTTTAAGATSATGSVGPILGCTIAIAGALLALAARDTLQRLLGSGAVGIGSAALFLFRGAPDIAFTQLAVETVFVVVAAIALRRYRPFPGPHTTIGPRLVLSTVLGVVVARLLLAILTRPLDPTLADYFLAQSYPQAHGRNVVNVIIVDFRGLDTLGEISVVMFAVLAAWPLMLGRSRRQGDIGGRHG
jgi:multicomponent Na+:H+ antiporter subunit A